MQKDMLIREKQRLERLIGSIEQTMKGAGTMDFTVFSKDETEELFQTMVEHMPENIKDTAVAEFGSLEQWKEHYMEAVGTEKIQKQYAKIVEWYGGKDAYIASVKNPVSKEVAASYQNRIDHILEKLADKQDLEVNCFGVRELIAEYGFVMKQLLQLKDEKGMMRAQAEFYQREESRKRLEKQYGDGFSEFVVQAIMEFYK